MSDIELMLRNDNRSKKSAGRGAAHKKGGAYRKGCTLPFELSAKNRNGAVVTTNIHRPMRWEEFKTLSDDVKRLYFNYLIENFDVSQRIVAEMFGTSKSNVQNVLARLNIKWPKHKLGNDMNRKAVAEKFREFCGDLIEEKPKKKPGRKPKHEIEETMVSTTPEIEETLPEESALPVETAIPEEPDLPVEVPLPVEPALPVEVAHEDAFVPETAPAEKKEEIAPCLLEVMQMCFSGVSSWDALYEKLKHFPIEGSLRVSIECRPESE